MGCRPWVRQRSSPKPETFADSPVPARSSSTPDWHPGNGCQAPSRARRGSPAPADRGLRVAAWRAMWGAMKNNEVYAERYRHLTTREVNKLKPTQAQTAIAGSDPQAAPRRGHHRPARGTRPSLPAASTDREVRAAGRLIARRRVTSRVGASLLRHREPTRYLVANHRQPRLVVHHSPITRCRATSSVTAMQGLTTSQGPHPSS